MTIYHWKYSQGLKIFSKLFKHTIFFQIILNSKEKVPQLMKNVINRLKTGNKNL